MIIIPLSGEDILLDIAGYAAVKEIYSMGITVLHKELVKTLTKESPLEFRTFLHVSVSEEDEMLYRLSK
jgi:hypothetical protein